MTPEDIVNGYHDKPQIKHVVMNIHQLPAVYCDSLDVIYINFPLCENDKRLSALKELKVGESASIWDTWGSDNEYYSALFHEFGHSTMHPKRLNRRPILKSFDIGLMDKPLGWKFSILEEEIIAKIVAEKLCEMAGIEYYGPTWSHEFIREYSIDENAILSAALEAIRYLNYARCGDGG